MTTPFNFEEVVFIIPTRLCARRWNRFSLWRNRFDLNSEITVKIDWAVQPPIAWRRFHLERRWCNYGCITLTATLSANVVLTIQKVQSPPCKVSTYQYKKLKKPTACMVLLNVSAPRHKRKFLILTLGYINTVSLNTHGVKGFVFKARFNCLYVTGGWDSNIHWYSFAKWNYLLTCLMQKNYTSVNVWKLLFRYILQLKCFKS